MASKKKKDKEVAIKITLFGREKKLILTEEQERLFAKVISKADHENVALIERGDKTTAFLCCDESGCSFC